LTAREVSLAVEVGGVRLKNPVVTASGCAGYGREYARFYPLARLGAVVVKSTTLEPRLGNPPPRVVETPAGMLNSIGLQNPGVDRVISEEIPWLREQGATIVVNVAGFSLREYAELARRLDRVEGVSGLELNISCPNVERQGTSFCTRPDTARDVVRVAREATGLPLWVKLSPNVADIGEMAQAVAEAGADAISLINTLVGMAIDVDARRPVLPRGTGGLSGPAIRPVALAMVYRVAQVVEVPVVGMGGIATARDALAFLLAGASAVAVGTASFSNPVAAVDIVEGIESYLREQGFSDVRAFVGLANPDLRAPRGVTPARAGPRPGGSPGGPAPPACPAAETPLGQEEGPG